MHQQANWLAATLHEMQRDSGRLTLSDGWHKYRSHRFFEEGSAHQDMVWEMMDGTPC